MTGKDPSYYLRHILDCCSQLQQCAALRSRDDIPPSLLLDAVCRNIEVIGEAAGKFRASHPEIPWRQMIASRNVLIHNYEGVDPTIVWGIVERDVPALQAAVERILGPAR